MRVQRQMVPMWLSAERRRRSGADWHVERYPSVFFFQGKSIKTVAWFPSLPEKVARRPWHDHTWASSFKPVRHPLAFPALPAGGPQSWGWESILLTTVERKRRAWQIAMRPSVFGLIARGEKTPSLDPEV